MEISCNPFYDITGKGIFKCIDGVWESSLTTCSLNDTIFCTEPPGEFINNSRIMTLRSKKIMKEYGDNYSSKELLVYKQASYVCPQSNLISLKNTSLKSKVVENRTVYYVDINCIGKNKWERIHCA